MKLFHQVKRTLFVILKRWNEEQQPQTWSQMHKDDQFLERKISLFSLKQAALNK